MVRLSHSRAFARTWRGLTLIEALVAIAIVGVLIAITGPSLRDMIVVQRLRGVNAQLVTDLQFGRSEAVSRNTYLRFSHRFDSTQTCYVLYTFTDNTDRCDCRNTPACTTTNVTEVRSVRVSRDQGVSLDLPGSQVTDFDFDPITGAIRAIPSDRGSPSLSSFEIRAVMDASRTFKTTVGRSGRPTICAVDGPALQATPCP